MDKRAKWTIMLVGDEKMTVVFEQVLILVLFAAVGYLLSSKKIVDPKHTKMLSALEIYVFLPCTVFNTFSSNFTIDYLKAKYSIVLISAVMLVILAVVTFFLSKILTKDPYQRYLYTYSMTIPNYGYMGYALAGSLFGDEVLLNVMMFVIPLSLLVYTVGYCMLTKTKVSFKRLLNPPLLAVVIGAAAGLLNWTPPSFAGSMIQKAAACMAPVSMLLTGIVISEYHLLPLLKNKVNYIVAALRLLVIPCLAGAVLVLLKLEIALIPTVIIYSMPCGLNTVVFPRLIGEDCKTGASLALISSVACCATVPFCIWLFTH